MKLAAISLKPELVKAVQLKIKKQTRRTQGLDAINQNPNQWDCLGISQGGVFFVFQHKLTKQLELLKCPYNQIGDVLYIKETHQVVCEKNHVKFTYSNNQVVNYYYKFFSSETLKKLKARKRQGKNTPARFMPKEAARLFLKITNVRVERLQDISEQDIKNEGVFYDGNWIVLGKQNNAVSFLPKNHNPTIYQCLFAKWGQLWVSINGIESWNLNPWVWVIDFKLTEKPSSF